MKAAAIQMTSGPDVPTNLQQAGALLAQARERGAALAVLPENFALMGMKEGDKIAAAEAEGSGPIQDFIAATAQKLSMWIVAGTMPMRIEGERRVAPASLVFNANGT